MPPIRRPEERIASTLGRLAAGTLGGTVDTAAKPVTPVGEVRTPGGDGGGEVPFHLPGAVLVTASDKWPAPRDIAPSRFRVWLTESGSTTTTVKLYDQDDTEVASVSFASGEAGMKDTTTMAVASIPNGGAAYTATTAAGSGASGIVAVMEY
jgi:hypothetical protein